MFFLSLFTLFSALISLWIKKTPWIWGTCLLISVAAALSSKEMQWQALIPFAILTVLCCILYWDIQGLARLVIVSLIILLSGAVFTGLLSGFPTPFLISNAQVNYGKILIGVLLLGGPVTILNNRFEWIQSLKLSLPLSIVGASLLFVLTLSLNFLIFKSICTSFPLWTLFYLLGNIIPEEALLRGFIQKELFQKMGGKIAAHIFSVLLTSIIFCLFHTTWITNLSFLIVTFVSSIIYGIIFQITRQVESCILCRWMTASLYIILLT